MVKNLGVVGALVSAWRCIVVQETLHVWCCVAGRIPSNIATYSKGWSSTQRKLKLQLTGLMAPGSAGGPYWMDQHKKPHGFMYNLIKNEESIYPPTAVGLRISSSTPLTATRALKRGRACAQGLREQFDLSPNLELAICVRTCVTGRG